MKFESHFAVLDTSREINEDRTWLESIEWDVVESKAN